MLWLRSSPVPGLDSAALASCFTPNPTATRAGPLRGGSGRAGVCDAGDGRQAHLLPSPTQRLHLESRSLALLAGEEQTFPVCVSPFNFRLYAGLAAGRYVSHSAPPRGRSRRRPNIVGRCPPLRTPARFLSLS
ncbi:hypothetical protein P7K49_030579 [Saguinus oedipus]|uniref:Uncharacterized protein n=1 Tax=Saguinus oedipus TaxID=9490 RepID=A0ABQ9U2J3_SAGOE|nr:hypothetical protein P7K49_030579 [Saguinus oedipus]